MLKPVNPFISKACRQAQIWFQKELEKLLKRKTMKAMKAMKAMNPMMKRPAMKRPSRKPSVKRN